MKGDFSRLTFKKKKNYNGVLKQQGRVSLDADANELIDILAHQRRVRTVDVIGTCCAPLNAGGFKIRHPGDNLQDLLISTGRIYVGGQLCELHPGTKIPVTFPTGSTYKVQVKEIKIDGQAFSENQWVVIFTKEDPEGILAQISTIDTTSNILTLSEDVSSLQSGTALHMQRMILYSEQPDYPDAPDWTPPPPTGRTDLVYLDVWERHITAIEDPDLREVALGGPDTTTRVQTVSQVKIFPNVGNVECLDDISSWNDEIAPSGGRLKTQAIPGTEPEDPCLIAEGGGYRRLENRLYRVEIHEGGDIGTATFKRSRDNGSIAYAIQEFIPDADPTKVFKVRLKQLGRDKILKIKDNNWLEISGDETDLDVKKAGTIAKVTNVDEAQRILTLSVDVAAHKDEAHAKVRRWDTEIDTPNPLTDTAAGPITLEDGIQILFSGENFKVGDYWIFAARTATGKVEELDYEPSHGIKHSYCKLALVKWNADGTVDIKECRHEFPSLCDLPKGGKGCCTVTVGEGGDFDNIQEAVDALKGGPGTVCILPGIYVIDKPISIRGWDITIKGCESASLILNLEKSPDNGTIFHIQNSLGITISNLWCVTLSGGRAVISGNSHFIQINDCLVMAAGIDDLAGAITFQGSSINTEIRDNLIAGMIGVRYEILDENKNNIHAASRIEQNIIFALQNAVLQTKNAPLLGFIVENNLLLGFGIGVLAKAFSPEAFLGYAEKSALYDQPTIEKAKAARNRGKAFESVTPADITPVLNFANHLKVESATAKIKGENILVAEVATAAPMVNLLSGALDANFQNNVILGKTGIYGTLMESSIERNIIVGAETGIRLELFEGVAIDDNIISAGGSGLQCGGLISFNLTASNNRFLSGTHGIEFKAPEKNTFHLAANIQISQNFMTVSRIGIEINNQAIWVYDFTAVDNSFSGCREFGIVLRGLDENQFLPEGVASFQRVVQRNSFLVKGPGIATALADTNILDNNITISYQPAHQTDISYGIIIAAENCTAANNTIEGVVNPEKNLFSKGGILIRDPISPKEGLNKNVVIRGNRISGGIGNGVEIASEIDNMAIESNLISKMGLNGIAVQEQVRKTDNLLISNNKILRCNHLVGELSEDKKLIVDWWKYAGIVLRSGEKIQILGNEICENGRDITNPDFHIGGIYAEQVNSVIIADNQLVDNGNLQSPTSQAIIHIPADPNGGNEDVKVVDNLVKGSLAPALFIGGQWEYVPFYTPVAVLRLPRGLDIKTVITGNHFETLVNGSAVDLQCTRCVFSNNYVECPDDPEIDAVDLGYGWRVTAIGNVTSAPISGFLPWFPITQVIIEHNVIF
ncbi:MAG: DUF6519 domain-containing protein [Planctomycetota bacterium]